MTDNERYNLATNILENLVKAMEIHEMMYPPLQIQFGENRRALIHSIILTLERNSE